MSGPSAPGVAVVHDRAAGRIRSGHPWVFSGDVIRAEGAHGDVVRVTDRRGHPLGFAFYSETSKISLRLVRREDVPPDDAFWASRVEQALARRGGLADPAGAYRAIFGESDGFPGLVVDVYAGHAVLQALTAGAERIVPAVLDALAERTEVSSVLARNDPASRTLEGLPREVKALRGVPPRLVEVREGTVAYLADPWHGQKTGAFLDQRTNRIRLGELARGTVLDVFSYHGSFAMHAAARAERVVAIDSSADALRRARENAALNGFRTVEFVLGNAFDELRARAAAREEWDVVVLDPPAFAKGRSAAESARRGYKEINVRAMRLVAPGGILLTCTCSFHMPESGFYDLLAECAADAGRVFRVAERRGAGPDHPERLGFPESRYLKCAVLVREELS